MNASQEGKDDIATKKKRTATEQSAKKQATFTQLARGKSWRLNRGQKKLRAATLTREI